MTRYRIMGGSYATKEATMPGVSVPTDEARPHGWLVRHTKQESDHAGCQCTNGRSTASRLACAAHQNWQDASGAAVQVSSKTAGVPDMKRGMEM